MWLDLWTFTDWEIVDFPMDPQKVDIFAEGSTESKSLRVSHPALHWRDFCLGTWSQSGIFPFRLPFGGPYNDMNRIPSVVWRVGWNSTRNAVKNRKIGF